MSFIKLMTYMLVCNKGRAEADGGRFLTNKANVPDNRLLGRPSHLIVPVDVISAALNTSNVTQPGRQPPASELIS